MGSQNMPWAAIAASLKKEATQEQSHQLKEWLDLSPEHPAILSDICKTWLLTNHQTTFYEPDKKENWEKLMKQIGYSTSPKVRMNPYIRWVAAAAIIFMVFLGGVRLGEGAFHRPEQISMVRVIAPKGNKTQIVLPDSTHVWLNSEAELQYPSNFTAQNRQVYMKGECFFDVTKDSKNPFIVHSSRLQIKVYGTRFNVNEGKLASKTDVTLIEGMVEVYDLSDDFLSRLSPGEQLVYSNASSWISKPENPDVQISWVNNMLIFDDMPFEEVLNYLENWYGVTIQLDQTLHYNYNYTFKVKTESLREVLALISYITPISYNIEGDFVTLKYKKKMNK